MGAAGASIAAALVPAGVSATDSDWEVATTPVDSTLHDVVYTADGAYAVGNGGLVLERTATGWEKVLDGGPTGNGNDLYGATTTDDGERLWVTGASGAIGEIDVRTNALTDRSAPNDQTNNFNDVAATGRAGAADVYVADDSGAIHYSFDNGETQTWEYEVPGSGAGLSAIEFYGDRAGAVIDTNGAVFQTDDGVTWERIGLEDADVTFYGLDADAADDITVSGGNASVFEYDGARWTPESLGDADLLDVDTEGDQGVAVGGGGAVFEQNGEWALVDTPTGENLNAVATGATDLVVGASGLVLEQ